MLDGATYTSFINGKTIPAAWNVELDIPVIGSATPQGFAFIRVWGISLAEISQANDLGPTAAGKPGRNITVFGGFQKGLPLANPAQSGQLFSGTIIQAYGNWIGTDMTLDIVAMPNLSTSSNGGGVGTLAKPKNIVLSWTGGTNLGDALKNTLSTAFPGAKQNINIDPKLVSRGGDAITGIYPTLEQLARYVQQVSVDIIKTPGYPGVSIWFSANGTVNVTDRAAPKQARPIGFADLIGQPTWIESPFIQFKCPMRADLDVWDPITMPQTVVINTQQAASALLNQRAAFQGGFVVQSIRHVGNYRQPSADAWVSVFDAAPNVITGT